MRGVRHVRIDALDVARLQLLMCRLRVAEHEELALGHLFDREPHALAAEPRVARSAVRHRVDAERRDVVHDETAHVHALEGAVREHVQRLGRILRRKGDKFATLYELVSRKTGEVFTSERRREHAAYGGS